MKRVPAVLAAAAATLLAGSALAQGAKLKVGLMLPYTGTFAALGTAIENGFRLHVAEQGGKLGGREIEFVKVDDESDPAKATDNVNKLVKRDNVDVLVGTVHSAAWRWRWPRWPRRADAADRAERRRRRRHRPLCAPNIFRSSFSNWHPAMRWVKVVAKRGHKNVVTITWKYAAGEREVRGFKESFEKAGGKVVKELTCRSRTSSSRPC
jgi:branched-chain amino acid transport system substrate-binding protein